MYIPQTVLALWGSQFVLRPVTGRVADSGSGWDPSWDPRPRNQQKRKENNCFAPKQLKTSRKS